MTGLPVVLFEPGCDDNFSHRSAKYHMLIRELLCEIHFSDLYPRTFTAFHQKYAPLVGDTALYVNFTDAVGNTLDKGFSPKPNHRDPAGLYAYPLDYVLKHPSEIEYGQQARFLRVIRDTAQHKLLLNTMTQPLAVALLTRMDVAEPARMMATVQRRFKYFGGNLIAKQFFGVLQMYLQIGQKTVTSNQQQTALLLKAGIDALEDRATNSIEAVIYEAEPEQCVFLSRSAFRVIEVFQLRNEQSRSIHHADPREMLRRLPGLIAQAIGDRIVANNMTAERADKFSFYTATKRKIVVMTSKEYSFLTGHRQGSDHSKHKLTIAIMGPDFAPITATYESEVPFEQIAADMGQRFAKRTAAEGQSYDLMTEHGPDIMAVNQMVQMICAKLKLPFTPAPDVATSSRIFRTIQGVSAGTTFQHMKRDQLLAHVATVVASLWRDNRQPQGAQILQMYQAAAKIRKITTVDLHHLDKIAHILGLTGWGGTKKTGEDYSKTYGDLTIFRRGADLNIRLGEHEQKIAQIDNLQLTDWTKPSANNGMDHTFMLQHVKDLVAYLNEYRFTVEGYATYLPQFFGICYTGGKWLPFEQAATPLGHIGKLAVWILPPDKEEHGHRHVVAIMQGQTDWSDMGTAFPDPEKWQAQEILFTLNDQDQVASIGHQLATYLRQEKYRKNNPNTYSHKSYPDDMYVGKEGGKQVYMALEAANFDLYDFITEHGYSFAPSMSRDADLFGLVFNGDNDKLGKSYHEILNPIGTFGGIAFYTVVPRQELWGPMADRFFFIKRDDQSVQVARTERDHQNGKGDVKLVMVKDDLTPAERVAVSALLAARQVAIPIKLRSLLTVKKGKLPD